MLRMAKYLLGVAALAGWLAFALSPKGEGAPPTDAGPPDLDHADLAPIGLAGEVLSRDDALGLPAALAIVGDYLVVVDRGGQAPLHTVHRSTGELVSFGREGEGPGEFEATWNLDPDPGGSAFWVWDLGLQRLTLVELAGPRPAGPLRDSRIVRLRSSAPLVTGIARLTDGGWLATGLFTDGRLGEFDADGRFRGVRGAVPETGANVPTPVLQQAYYGPIEARPDRGRVAVGALQAGHLEIFDLASGSSALARVPFEFEPRFSVHEGSEGGPVMATAEDVRHGYVDLAATPTRLYALFSGRTSAGHPDRPTFGEHVHVFDWDGGFRGALRLEEAAIAVAVDGEAGVLYAVSHDPAPAIWRYALPEPEPRAP